MVASTYTAESAESIPRTLHFGKPFGILEPGKPEIVFIPDGSTLVIHQAQQLQSHHIAPRFPSPG